MVRALWVVAIRWDRISRDLLGRDRWRGYALNPMGEVPMLVRVAWASGSESEVDVKLYAVRVFVKDWETSCAFYRTVLGLEEKFHDPAMGWAEYDVGGPSLGIERVVPDDPVAMALVGRFLGVSLHVDDVDAVYQDLVGRGVEFLGPPESQPLGASLAHFKDPEGNVLTVMG